MDTLLASSFRDFVASLIINGSFKPIVTLLRRSQPDQVAMARGAGVELRETLVPAMAPAGLKTATTEAIRTLAGDVVGLSVLGVGAGTPRNSRSMSIARSTCN